MEDFLQRLNDLERRLANVFLLGTIIEADYENALIKAKSGELETGWLHWITARASNDADWWAPEVGEQVVVMCPNGDPELGVVLPAIYQNKHPAPDNKPTIRKVTFEDGAEFFYARDDHKLIIELPCSGKTRIVSQGGFDVVGDINVDGNIKSTGDISDKVRSMQQDRDIYNEHDHISSAPGSPTSPVVQKQ